MVANRLSDQKGLASRHMHACAGGNAGKGRERVEGDMGGMSRDGFSIESQATVEKSGSMLPLLYEKPMFVV